MSEEVNNWNTLAGELRSALAARDWHQAGAIIWQLRQLDGERFTLELEHYTNEQVRKGGYGMALETEQRLEALRLWAREGLERFPTAWPALILVMSQGFPAGEAAKTLAQHYKEWSFDTKRGLIYRGDIITEAVKGAKSLLDILIERPLTEDELKRIANTVALFHSKGVYHADLNINNILFKYYSTFAQLTGTKCM